MARPTKYTEAEKLAIHLIRRHLADAECDVDREAVIDDIREGYCVHCMSKHLPCYCWNNE